MTEINYIFDILMIRYGKICLILKIFHRKERSSDWLYAKTPFFLDFYSIDSTSQRRCRGTHKNRMLYDRFSAINIYGIRLFRTRGNILWIL
ncbi:MAG TPA: hypothetical protein VII93_14205, partial [Anaerolineales bacterium]